MDIFINLSKFVLAEANYDFYDYNLTNLFWLDNGWLTWIMQVVDDIILLKISLCK